MTRIASVSKAIEAIKGMDAAEDLSKYGKEFQLKLLALLTKDRQFSFSILPIIKNEYFSDVYLRKIFIVIQRYVEKYAATPAMDNIRIMLEDNGEKLNLFDKVLESINTVSLEDRDFVIDNVRKFCFTKHALGEIEKIKAMLHAGEFETAKATSTEAFKFSGLETAKIFDLKEDYNVIFDANKTRNPVPLPFKTFNDNMQGGPGAGELVISIAPSNFGKCFAPGTLIKMFSTLNRRVEDIIVGNKLMGWDGKARTVTSLARGTEMMYRVKQTYGMTYDVNGSHILVLKNGQDYQIETITVAEYIKKPKSWQIQRFGFKAMVDDPRLSELDVEEIGVGEYLGFTLAEDQDKMFLLGDSTVAHNTNALVALARHANSLGQNVAFFSFEIGGPDILRRHIAGLTDFKQEDVVKNKKIVDIRMNDEGLGGFKLIQERATNATIAGIRNNLDYLKSIGFFPHMICIDSLNQLKLPPGQKYFTDNLKFEYLAEELRDLANEEGIPVHSVFQTNRCVDENSIVNVLGKGDITIKDIITGDKILTADGYRTILDKFTSREHCYVIKLKSGKEIRCSAKHEFPTGDNKLVSIENGLAIGHKLLLKK